MTDHDGAPWTIRAWADSPVNQDGTGVVVVRHRKNSDGTYEQEYAEFDIHDISWHPYHGFDLLPITLVVTGRTEKDLLDEEELRILQRLRRKC